MHFEYTPQDVCPIKVEFDLDGDVVHNIKFTGGCSGNLKALSKVLEGYTVEEIENKLSGNTCGKNYTSCADQLAKAVRAAYDNKK